MSAAPFPGGVAALGPGWAGGRYTKEKKRSPFTKEKKRSPFRPSGEQIVCFTLGREGSTKELLPGGFAATLSLVVEEEMPPPFVVEEESMSP